jgi:hypothetical protein
MSIARHIDAARLVEAWSDVLGKSVPKPLLTAAANLEAIPRVNERLLRYPVLLDQAVLRDGRGSLSVLSAAGYERLLIMSQATEGAIKEQRDVLNAIVSKQRYTATMEQHAALMLSHEQSSVKSWLAHMKGLGDIASIPFEEWESWFLGYLKRLTSGRI